VIVVPAAIALGGGLLAYRRRRRLASRGDQHVIRELILFLRDRRVLYNEHESPMLVRTSVREIRTKVIQTQGRLNRASADSMTSLDRLRNACVELLERADTYLTPDGQLNRDLGDVDVQEHVDAVNRFRGSFQVAVASLMIENHIPATLAPKIVEQKKIMFFTVRPDREFHAPAPKD